MKALGLVLALAFVVPSISLTLVPGPSPATPANAPAGTTLELPAALARFYPPAAHEPEYLLRMHGLSFALSGVAADLLENDLEHARTGVGHLRNQYVEVAALVPEWKSRYPMQPLEQLEAALAAGETADCMRAVAALGAACHACHLETMVPVQQAYRWRSFSDVSCQDPETGEALSYAQLMRDLDLGLSGIAADVAQGQRPQAEEYFRLFRARFGQLEQTCLACHPGKREYYVDAGMRAQVEKLGTALGQDPVDSSRVLVLIQDIGERSCGRCHLVHVPAAMAHARAAR